MRPGLLLGVALSGVILVGITSDSHLEAATTQLTPALFRAEVAKTVAKAQLPLLVELYWLRVVNAIGLAETEVKNRRLAEYGRLLTDLDPDFYQVYYYLGLVVPYRTGVSVYRNQAEAAELLRRGVERFPQDARLRTIYGYTLFEMLDQPAEAAAQFEALSTLPGAPSYARRLSVRLMSQTGRAESALEVFENLLEGCPDDSTWECRRMRWEHRQIRIEVVLQRVERAAAAFFARTGRHATSVAELIEAKDYEGPPEDPEGQPIALTQGKASTASLERRFEAHH